MRKVLTSKAGPLPLHLGVVAYTAIMSYLSWVRFVSLKAPSFDFGVNIQTVYTAESGTPIDNPNYVLSWGVLGPNFFSIHFVPIVYIESPLLHIFSPAIALIVIQWLLLGLGAEVVYVIARSANLSHMMSLGIGAIYLVFPPTLMAGMYDTHFEAAFPLAALLLFYGLSRRKTLASLVGFGLGALSQESFLLIAPFVALQVLTDNEGGTVAMLRKLLATIRRSFQFEPSNGSVSSSYHLFDRLKANRFRILLIAAVVGPVLLFFVELWVLQQFGPHRTNLVTSSSGWGLSIQYLTLNPYDKTVYWTVLFGLLGFLPLYGFRKGWAILPGLVLSLFSDHAAFSQFAWQYTFIPIGGLFIATVEGFRRLGSGSHEDTIVSAGVSDNEGRGYGSASTDEVRGGARTWRILKPQSRKGIVFLAVILVAGCVFSPSLPYTFVYDNPRPITAFTPPSNYQSVEKLAEIIPAGANVLASDYLFPQVASNPNAVPILKNYTNGAYLLDRFTPPGWSAQFVLILLGDYLVVGALVPDFPADFSLRGVASIAEGSQFGVMLNEYVLLYERNYSGPVDDYAQGTVQFFAAGYFTSPTGELLPSGIPDFTNAIFVQGSPSGTWLVLHGPSTCCTSLDEIPGQYLLNVYVTVGEPSNATSNLVFQISAYSGEGSWGLYNVTRSMIANGSVTDLEFDLSLPQPISFFSISINALKANYSLYFYGLKVIRTD